MHNNQSEGGTVMIHIAVCDEKKEQCQALQTEVQSYFARRNKDVNCTAYTNTFHLLGDMEKSMTFDIILIDVGMKGISGIDVVKEMHQRQWSAEIIFLSEDPDFAVEAFSLHVAYYLIRPYTPQAFEKALDTVMTQMQQYHSHKMIFHLVGSGIRVEEVNHIVCIESDGHIQSVYLSDGTSLQVRQSLASLRYVLDKMAPGQFVSPSKGYLVNQDAIHIIKSDYIECRGRSIPLVKRKYRQFLHQYLNFVFNGQY
jgi:DNA-binding LytR/AlgR family response regulator